MSTAWIPKNFEDACKRNAGRRKLHMRRRHARAERIGRILAAIDAAGAIEPRESAYGWLKAACIALGVSKATASRDFALVRRIDRQFLRMFGRSFDPKRDKVVWDWHWSHYGFIAAESRKAGYKNPVGQFPFDTRKHETEESYGGFTQLSWQNTDYFAQLSTRDLMRALMSNYRRLGRN